MKKIIKSFVTTTIALVGLYLLSFFKINTIVYAKPASFSLFSLAPAWSMIFQLPFALCALVTSLFLKAGFSLYSITLGLPTMAATVTLDTFSSRSAYAKLLQKFFLVLLPLSCIVAFALHPVGMQAMGYSSYWIIPLIVYAFHRRNASSLFLRALASTFVAHAVGGAMWLYFVPSTPAQWLALIPVVALERITIALGISGIVVLTKMLFTPTQWRTLFKKAHTAVLILNTSKHSQ